jgi:microcystin-dependent protein
MGQQLLNLPNLQDAVVVNKSPTKALASTGGANTVASTGNISGTLANTTLSEAMLPAHTHANGFSNGPLAVNVQNRSGYGTVCSKKPYNKFFFSSNWRRWSTQPPLIGKCFRNSYICATTLSSINVCN